MAEKGNEVVEKGNDIITIYKEGKELEVTRKAFNVHYAAKGYKLESDAQQEDIDYTVEYLQGLSPEELENVTNPNLKLALDKEEITYAKNATKKDLISLIPTKE